MKKDIGVHERLYPNPVVLVSSSYENQDNIITLAWTGTVCSNPPLISISIRPSRHSHGLIKNSGEFVINIPNQHQADLCNYCGTVSGKDTDKFKQLDLTKASLDKVKARMIEDCPVNIGCRVRDIISLGTHDLFIAEVTPGFGRSGLGLYRWGSGL
ncbi:MAG: flavin reductase family protein [Actinomycetota bacterium]|nr:flavin reductase family protein [Actinomycetota bacterium]